MKKVMRIVPWILVIVLGIIIGKQVLTRKSQDPTGKIKSDTVYIDRRIEIPKPYPVYQIPERVEIYKTDTVKISQIREIKDTLVIYLETRDSLKYNHNFLTNYPENHKLISFDLKRDKLELDILTISGMTIRENYKLNLESSNYRYVNNRMTSKRVSRIILEPAILYQYRPFNKLHDINGGLNLKMGSKWEISGGIQGSYYPKFKADPFVDISVGLKYRFK